VPSIEQVLGRRTDLSTFVVHLTKRNNLGSALESLLSILRDGTIEARTWRGWALRKTLPRDEDTARDALFSQRAVCFTEAPLEQIRGLIDIDDRQVDLRPYGLAFTKIVARRKGINPVWYVDTTHAAAGVVRQAVDELLDRALGAEGPFIDHPAARLFPFMEDMGFGPSGHRKEFWWEREWRHVGDFSFEPSEIALVLAPASDHGAIAQVTSRPCVDPAWSLERMIGSLAGLPANDVTPFTA